MSGSEALRLVLRGRVQGVGFRPFIARAACACRLSGWVRNGLGGVTLHVEGRRRDLERFRMLLADEAPPAAEVRDVAEEPAFPRHYRGFHIRPSLGDDEPNAGSTDLLGDIPPDRATCARCLGEFEDPNNRRFDYAMIACTDCGPRFTMLHALPFDRDRTAMAVFPPCPECQQEYESSVDRRFHAQNIACPACGPRLRLDGEGPPSKHGSDRDAIAQAAALLRDGNVVAFKGVGGFHLLCDATSPEAVDRLRQRKRRDRKPLAVLFADRQQLDSQLVGEEKELATVSSPAAPIVLMRRRPDSTVAEGVAPGLGIVGAMLPYTAAHRELARATGRPLVATSANLSDEPMPIADSDADTALAGVADALLLHDRAIVRAADDSLVRVIGGRAVALRVGRGLAPVRLPVPLDLPPILAVGGHLKAAVAVTRGREIVLGPHVGDLFTPSSRRRYREAAADLARLCGVTPRLVACDRHPDYFTTRFARECGLPVVAVQHHVAHVAACLAEHGAAGPALGIAWDGTGFGDDGTTWGGEFLRFDRGRYHRVGSLWPFPLVGGDRVAREPRRSAAGVCHAAGEPAPARAFDEHEAKPLAAALRSPRMAVPCTSVGRLFDAWASLLGLCDRAAYEAEAALRIEAITDEAERGEFPTAIVEQPGPFYRVDWRPWVAETRRLLKGGTPPATVAARFHNALARCCVEVAHRVGCPTVALGGGCFQNRLLSERAEAFLAAAGFRVLAHWRIPPGDGGLAVGQAWAAALAIAGGGGLDVPGDSR